ncbi:oxidoreductase [Pseudoroseomonas ludipueritiae]|uniref:FAD-dependent oxidoreductase n=1 Tax=Pseudoroseomonas ludipueritiae TaxID=198093 RepID=A0ABR7RAS8_9PROT|nr:FAD-dependent oxidoreductase [Pseudoroseomonas ludipueritiae]MBC9178900.1 FAD-dependent oxidoreductase [Pseudoroseomonas ludipueritiae]
MSDLFPRLFASFGMRGHELRNRIGFAAMSCRLAAGGRATPALLKHLEARAAGGAAIVITEAMPAARSAATPTRVSAFSEDALPDLAAMAEVIARHGALPVGQLWHPGSANRGQRAVDAVGASAVPDGLSWTVPRILADAEIGALCEEYAETAHRLQRAGFAGVEVSAAHGFLPLQFLSPVSNLRQDRWGGDLWNRSRFLRNILALIRERCGPGFLVGLKMPADDGLPGSIDPEEAARITALIAAETPPDWFCYSQGTHGWSLGMHAPDQHAPPLLYRALWRRMRQAAGGVPVAAVARINHPAAAEELLSSGEADLVMLARPLLADPRWAEKARRNAPESIRPCLNCNACWGEINKGSPIACAVNPRAGGRDGDGLAPASAARHVVVVGGGPAGLQAAISAARRGRRVTLLSARAPGGAARMESALPGGASMAAFLDYLTAEATRSGVRTQQGIASPEAILALRPDAVVLATGASMARPTALQGSSTGLDLRTLLAAAPPGGGVAVLYDHDHTPGTYAAAEWLAGRYARLLLVTPRDSIAQDVPLLSAQGVHRRLARLGVEILPCRRLLRHEGRRLWLSHLLTGAEEEIEDVDLLTWSTPRQPRQELLAPLQAAGLEVHLAGDALAPRLMLSAIREGAETGEAV